MNQDKLHQHTIQFQRIINRALKDDFYPALELSYKQVRALLLDAESLTSISKVTKINRLVNQIITDNVSKAWKPISAELEDIAAYESDFTAGLVAASLEAGRQVKKPAKKQVLDYVNKSLMSLHSGDSARVGTWAEYVVGNTKGTADTINNLIKAGYVNGDTVQKVSRSIKTAFDGMVKSSAETLARTGVNHYANQAAEAMAQANSDILEYRYFSATLDNRTSAPCRAYDGQKWKLSDKSYPRLPIHYNERSRYVFLVKGQKLPDAGRPAVGAGDDFDKGNTFKGKKDIGKFKVTQTKPATNYESWLRRQPVDFQEDVLGVGKAKLFREGLSLKKFIDLTGRPLTLKELKKFDIK